MTAPLSTAPIRPRWARIVAVILLLVVVGGAALLIHSMVRAGTEQAHYTVSIVTLALATTVFLVMHLRVVAKPSREGLFVRNLVTSHHLKWEEIISVRFSADRPWAQLDLAIGDPVSVMAIQSADGEYARANAQRLANWVRQGEAREP